MIWPQSAADQTAFGLGWTLARMRDLFFRYALVGLTVVPTIMLLEIVSVGWRDSSLRSLLHGSKSARSDAICFLLVHLRLMRWPQILLTLGFALISGEMVHDFAVRHLGFDLALGRLPPLVAYPLYFLLFTFFDCVAHLVDHSDLFWPLHRYHHGAEDFHVMTADRGHPASALTQGGLKIFPLALLGMPGNAIIDVGMLLVAIDYMNHSRINWDFGWVGRWLVQSPRHHQLHHARDVQRVTNYSACPLWDRLFGTWEDPATHERPVLGTYTDYRHGLMVIPDMWHDYRDFVGRVYRFVCRRPIEPSDPRKTL